MCDIVMIAKNQKTLDYRDEEKRDFANSGQIDGGTYLAALNCSELPQVVLDDFLYLYQMQENREKWSLYYRVHLNNL
jgi:hypothetical protein